MGTVYIYIYIYIHICSKYTFVNNFIHYIERQSPPFSWQKRLLGILFRKKRHCFSAAVRGESVLSVVFTMVFVCIHADLPSHWKCSLIKFYMVCLCSKYAEIKGADLCIWFSDVISAHLEHVPMFYICVRVCSKYGLGHFGKFDVLSSCPQLYIHQSRTYTPTMWFEKKTLPFCTQKSATYMWKKGGRFTSPSERISGL